MISGMFSEVAHMYSACLSTRGSWPCWGYARAVISLADRSIMTLRAVRLWGRNISVPCFAIYRELLWIAAGLSDADSNLVSWRVKRRLMSQDASGHPRALVGQCDSSFVAVHTFGCTSQPFAKAKIGPSMRAHHYDFCRWDEQHP